MFNRPDGPGKSRTKITVAAGLLGAGVFAVAKLFNSDFPMTAQDLSAVLAVLIMLAQHFLRDARGAGQSSRSSIPGHGDQSITEYQPGSFAPSKPTGRPFVSPPKPPPLPAREAS